MAREESVVLDVDVDLGDSIESIDKLTAANKELRKERNALNLTSEAGKKRAQEINTVIDQNTSKIKANVSAIEQQKINIGNYKSALDGVHPALGQVASGLEKGTSGLKAMTLQALRFIATPIGAVLAAIVAVFALLKSALSQNDALMDKFENVTNAVSVVLEVVVGRVGKLGEALVALFSGNFDEALNLTSEAFAGLGDEIQKAVTQQQLFLDASRRLEDAQIDLTVQTSKYENEIKRLVVAAKNRNLTFDEQEALLNKALGLEKELVAVRTDIARQDLVITARRLRSNIEFQQTANETFDEYINRLLKSEKLGFDERQKIAEKVTALDAARGSSLAFQEKQENTLSAIQDKRADVLKKQNEELQKQVDLQQKAQDQQAKDVLQGSIEAIQRQIAAEKELQQLRNDARAPGLGKDLAQLDLDLAERLSKVKGTEEQISEQTRLLEEQRNQDVVGIREKYRKIDLDNAKAANDKIAADTKKLAEVQIKTKQAELGATANLLGATASLFEENSSQQKILLTAQALMNTYAAANAALRTGSEINPFVGFASAAAAVIAGLANVAQINGVEFAEGGYTGPGTKHQPAGFVHKGEVVWSQEDVKKVGGPSIANAMRPTARRAMPVYSGKYFDGGLVTNSISQPINQQLELLNIVKNIPPGVISVKEINTVQKRVKVKEQISKR